MNALFLKDGENGAREAGEWPAAGRLWLGAAACALALAAYALAGAVGAAIAAGVGLGALGVARIILPRSGLGAGGEGKALLAEAMESCPEGVLVTSAEGAIVYANEPYRALVGDHGGDPPPTLIELVAGEEEARETLLRLEAKTLAGTPGRDEVWAKMVNGERRWLTMRTHAFGGASRHVVWRVVDSTPQHEVQEVIRQEQEKLADFLDHAPIGFFSVDTEGRLVFVNSTFARWLGYTPEEMTGIGTALEDFIVDGGALGRAADGDDADVRHGEFRLKTRDGDTVPVYIRLSLARGPGGEAQTRSMVLNLSQQQEWENALRVAEKRFRRFFDHAPIGIVMVNGAGQVVEANKAFADMIGTDVAGGEQTPLISFVSPDDRNEVVRHMAGAVRGEPSLGAVEIHLEGDTPRPAQLYVSRLGEAGGEASDLVLHLIDTSEQKKLELRFTQSQKMQAVGQLAGGIAHDFNNLLTAMIGFCDLVLLRHQPGDTSFADVMQIKQNANRAANLVRQLLAFSRQQTLQPKVLSITDMLAELSNLLRRLIGENIDLKMLHGGDVGLAKVDQGQFEQVIINLAVNARDAMPQGGRLTIRTSTSFVSAGEREGRDFMPPGEYVLIEVIDTGHGIKPDDIGKIFEPFFTTKEVGAGTGLGLATVYGIVKQTGGFIFIESEPGKGAAFNIYLPRYYQFEASESTGEGADEPAVDLTGEGTILLVEDEEAVRIFAGRALRNKGYHVLEADSGEAALDLVAMHGGRIDLLISDVVMPQMDGPTLVRRTRESWPAMKAILISGYSEDGLLGGEAGAAGVAFLPKPFSLRRLAGKVKEVMSAESA